MSAAQPLVAAPSPELLVLIAERFRSLGEPTRLRLLDALRAGETTVTDLVEKTGLGQANVSKHLASLYAAGLVARRRSGLFVYYTIADGRIFLLCDLVCSQLDAASLTRRRVIASDAA
jgi:DNA-binding transcriptional ArsR family regulator